MNPTPFDPRPLADRLAAAATRGMSSAVLAAANPLGAALITPDGVVAHSTLHQRANRVAALLRSRGVGHGDAVALMSRNRREFVEVLLGALRIGARLTPIATALRADEAAYIVRDCGAQLFFVEPGLAGEGTGVTAELEFGEAYEAALAALGAEADADPAAPEAGNLLLYTSGTTGRPKGVQRPGPDVVPPQLAGSFFDYQPGDVHLCAGPAYHAAPLLLDLRWPLASGTPVVLLPKWEALPVLQAIHQHRVTHMHCVPTMFQRLLALPQELRLGFDLSSLRLVAHGAAPCPIPVKRAMIHWLGPILLEYYGATEGGDGVHINSQDWLLHPGAVGRLTEANGHVLLDDALRPVPVGESGTLWLRAPAERRFAYRGDDSQSAASYHEGFFTLGDRGRVDAEGWLTLTGRRADLIISGGVNIDPGEVDALLMQHAAVSGACTVGAPDDEWGEKVVSVVIPAAGVTADAALADTLIAHVGATLAAFKRPREIVFTDTLPHTDNGKLLRREVRQRFWSGTGREL